MYIETIEAMIPISIPHFDIVGLSRKQIRLQTLDLIVERNGKQRFNLNEYGEVFPTFEILEEINDTELLFKIPITISVTKYLHIIVDIDIKEDIESLNSSNGIPVRELHKSIISSLFEKRIYDYTFALNLSTTNSLCLNEGIIRFKSDKFIYKTNRLNPDFILEAVSLAESKQWPKFKSIPVDQICNWLNNQQGFLDGFGGGKTGRALNAIVNISFQNDYGSPESLFWVMVGLESLYTSGKSGLLEQVRDKSQVLLGHQKAFKRILSNMYDFRSRFVHGDLDFATPNHLYDSDEIMNYYSDLSNAFLIASAVLICTVQELIYRDWSGLDFKYIVSDIQE